MGLIVTSYYESSSDFRFPDVNLGSSYRGRCVVHWLGPKARPLTILGMAFFGVITVPLWPTYIPALIATPLVMKRLSQNGFFQTFSLPVYLITAVPTGAIAGVLILLLPAVGSGKSMLIWMLAGALAGAVTLPLIVLAYAIPKQTTQ